MEHSMKMSSLSNLIPCLGLPKELEQSLSNDIFSQGLMYRHLEPVDLTFLETNYVNQHHRNHKTCPDTCGAG